MVYKFVNSGIEEEAAFSDESVRDIFLPLLKRLTELRQQKERRIFVMLAAPPGAGKSTLASFLQYLSGQNPALTPLTVIGMDGFHRDQEYLLSHTLVRDGEEIPMVKVKGTPETFDLDLLKERVGRVAAGENCGWPVYDRILHNPVDNAVAVTGDIVLMEGNYLLLEAEGWNQLRKYADFTISIRANEALLRERLIRRKISTGVSAAEAEVFVDYSDMYNVRLCQRCGGAADLILETDGDQFGIVRQ